MTEFSKLTLNEFRFFKDNRSYMNRAKTIQLFKKDAIITFYYSGEVCGEQVVICQSLDINNIFHYISEFFFETKELMYIDGIGGISFCATIDIDGVANITLFIRDDDNKNKYIWNQDLIAYYG